MKKDAYNSMIRHMTAKALPPQFQAIGTSDLGVHIDEFQIQQFAIDLQAELIEQLPAQNTRYEADGGLLLLWFGNAAQNYCACIEVMSMLSVLDPNYMHRFTQSLQPDMESFIQKEQGIYRSFLHFHTEKEYRMPMWSTHMLISVVMRHTPEDFDFEKDAKLGDDSSINLIAYAFTLFWSRIIGQMSVR